MVLEKVKSFKAIVEFHKRLKVENTLKLCANTGTAAKHIGGSTTTTLFGFSCLFVCFSHFLPLERLGGLESHVKVAMV